MKVPGAEYTTAFKRGWDGWISPGNARFDKKTYQYTLSLGRGWLSDVQNYFQGAEVQKHYETSLRLNTDVLEQEKPEEWNMLRDYQKNSIQKVMDHKWGRVALATNAGKGAIIALLAYAALPKKTIILADEIAVFDALREEIEKWAGSEPGLVESGAKEPPTEKICLAMIPTLSRRVQGDDAAAWLEWLESFSVGLLDEADRATADTWKLVCDGLVNTEYRAGFSGSFPEAGSIDDFNLMGILGPTLIRVKNKELVERDISAKPFVQLVPYKIRHIPPFQWSEDKLKDPEFDHENETPTGPALRRWAYRQAVIENEERHELIRRLLHPTAPNAIIVSRIDHGEILNEHLPNSVFLSGSDSKERRREVLEQFQSGNIQNLIATNILDRGSNKLGSAVGLVFASGEGSKRQTLQRIGRGLRKTEEKEFLFLRDVMDTGQKYLDKASKKRLKLYQEEGFDISFYENPDELQEE